MQDVCTAARLAESLYTFFVKLGQKGELVDCSKDNGANIVAAQMKLALAQLFWPFHLSITSSFCSESM